MKVRKIFLLFILLSLSSVAIVEVILSKNIENLSDIYNRYGVTVKCDNFAKDSNNKENNNNCKKQSLALENPNTKRNNLKLLPDKKHLETNFEIPTHNYEYKESDLDLRGGYMDDRELLMYVGIDQDEIEVEK